jgi:hypothetical protein
MRFVVRSFLARRGLKKGDLSKFIEAAVKGVSSTGPWPRPGTGSPTPEALETVIDEAVAAARQTCGRGSYDSF